MRRLWLAALVVLTAACGQLPRPFQDADPTNNLLTLKSGAGVYVAPITGETLAGGGPLSEQIAEAIREQEIPASTTSSSRGNYTLRGHATRAPDSRAETLRLLWELRDPAGAVLMARRIDLSLTAAKTTSPQNLADVVAEVAPAVVDLLQEPESSPPRLAGFPEARLVVAALPALDGEDSGPLKKAIETELRRSGLPLAETATEQDLLLIGDFQVSSAREGRQRVVLSWSVIESGDGALIGQVEQANEVPAGSLRLTWARMSPEIARNAVAGIQDLLAQAGRKGLRPSTAAGDGDEEGK